MQKEKLGYRIKRSFWFMKTETPNKIRERYGESYIYLFMVAANLIPAVIKAINGEIDIISVLLIPAVWSIFFVTVYSGKQRGWLIKIIILQVILILILSIIAVMVRVGKESL